MGLLILTFMWTGGEERPILVRGYVVTEKGKKTAEYKLAHDIERKICKECFDLDIGGMYALSELEEAFDWLD